ncbi:MAG TPA: hypothetical protein VI300_21145 [Solirubrobacter sp.]
MGDLLLTGMLNFTGSLNLVAAAGGKVKANAQEVLVQGQRGAGPPHGNAPAPVLIPPPPASPSDPGVSVWVFQSFNATIKAGGTAIVTQGMCAQGNPGTATWPGMVQASMGNPGIKANAIAMNVANDLATILPTGAPAPLTTSGQL